MYRLSLDTNFVPSRIATLGHMGRGGVKKPPARFDKGVFTVKKKYRLSAGIALLSKGEFKLGAAIGSEPDYVRFRLDLYLLKFNAWIAVIER